MKIRGIAPTIAFYIGVISIIFSILVKGFGLLILDISASGFIHFANAWFLIAIVCYLHDIWGKIAGKIEFKKE